VETEVTWPLIVFSPSNVPIKSASTRSFDAMLFDLTPLDPATYAVVAILFRLVSLTGAFAAARHAASADPVVALRSE
jgi:hypothetical protein